MSLPQCTLCAGCLAPWRFLAGWRLGGPRARQWLTYVLCGHCVPCGVLGVSGIDGLFGEASSGCHFGPGVWWARREAAGWDVARGVGMGCHAMCMLGCGSWWETDGWWKWCWRPRCPGDRAGREDRMGEGGGDEGRVAGNRRSAPGWCGGVAAIYHWELRALSGVLCFGWALAPVEAGGRRRFLASLVAFLSVFLCCNRFVERLPYPQKATRSNRISCWAAGRGVWLGAVGWSGLRGFATG